MALVVPAKGRHVVVVTLEGFEPITQRVDTARAGETIEFTLVDADLARLERELKKAQAAHDKANTRLEIAQEQSTAAPDSNTKSRALEKAELAMQAATETLEEAEKALNQTKKNRMSERERLEAANKVRAVMEKPPPPSSSPGAAAGGSPTVRNGGTVFCAWEIPLKSTQPGKNWVDIRNGCFPPPVSAATASCNQRAKGESAEATACDCTDDKALAAKCR